MYRGISDLKKGYQPKTNIVKHEKGDRVTDTVLWLDGGAISLRSLMYMGLMMLGRKIHAAETLVPQPSACEVEMSIEKLKRRKTPGIDQIPEELINTFSAKLNPICHALTLLGAHHILHASRIRVKGGGRAISSEPINLFYLE